MLNLSVHIDPDSGFCFGVVYAIKMAEDILDERGHLYCLGDIVHNDAEVKRLEAKGLRIINHAEMAQLKDETVMIRAHGEAPTTYRLALENNLELVDASCPVVLKLQNRIKESQDKGEHIFIYGKKGHAEVDGLVGQTGGNAVVFHDVSELQEMNLPDEITLYSQTTKSTDRFYEFKSKLQEMGKTVKANDTICRQVSNRDTELRDFSRQYDRIVFVAGTKSSNGKMLYEVCKAANANSYFVSGSIDVQREWFGADERIGICGATSTPFWLMQEVKEYIQSL